jgi:succinoglycan biosynthesis protein ExoM
MAPRTARPFSVSLTSIPSFGKTQAKTMQAPQMDPAKAMAELALVGICTYRRPAMLSNLLSACGKLEAIPHTTLALLVVDNDPAGSAREIVEAASKSLPIPLHYCVEPTRGIANARNRVLKEAVALHADYLALIDDDEIMNPDWLVELRSVLEESGADAVGAPSYWDLPGDAPAWQHALPTSARYERLHGDRKKSKSWIYPSTNNVLMRSRIYRELGTRFDARFGMTGGEDTDFFRRAKEAGARYAFARNAVVLETVPPSRLTLRWRLWRWAGVARGNVRMHRLQHGERSVWRHYLPRCLPNFVTGPALLLAAPFAGHATMLRGLKHLGGGVGILQELLGYKSEEYKTTHGA